MKQEDWERISEVFHAASELDISQRAAFLDRECRSDEVLRREVESLLAAEADAGDFITEPAVGSFLSDEPDARAMPGEMIGRFRIVKRIGSGGMGEVYHAVDTSLDRDVALKTLPVSFESDPAFKKRFETEAKAAATLHHPNVATVFSIEEIGSKQYIAMELVIGRTLDTATASGPLSLNTFLDWFLPITSALELAHSKGVIHRDVKPGNIMIGEDDVPKVLDFGLARIEPPPGSSSASLHVTNPGQLIGTPSYMSPEQAEGKSVDTRSDIFSLGVVMYEALSGQKPFAGDSYLDIIRNITTASPTPISTLRPDLPQPLVALVEKCLAKKPSARFRSMTEVRSVLEAVRSGAFPPPSVDSFVRRFYSEARGPSWLWLAGAAAIVLIASVGAWYLVSRGSTSSKYSVDRMSMRKLSQSNDVALSVISPDGRSIAYVTYESDDSRALWFRRVSESTSVNILPSQEVHFWDIGFSGDGESVYYITAPRYGTHGNLFRIPALGGQPRKIAEKVNHLGNLSPDGKRILFVRYGDPAPASSVNVTDSKLIAANAEDGSEEQVIRVHTGETVIRKPRYSSDGRSVYYIRRSFDGTESWAIVALDTASGNEREIVEGSDRIENFAVLAKGEGLLVNSEDANSRRRQLFYVAINGGELTRVTNDLNSYSGVSVDSEGRNIVSVQRIHESRLWVGDSSDPRSMKPLSREPFGHQSVDWTIDGKLVFDVIENNRLSIWTSDTDGSNPTQLTPQDSDNSSPRVSGDGQYIVFTSKRSGANQIWRMKIDGSEPRLLADVRGITQSPVFAADGRTVVFRWYNEGSPPMGQVSIDGGAVTGLDYLPKAFTYYWAMSPDGKYVAYTSGGEADDPMKIVVRPADLSPPIHEFAVRPTWIMKWSPDSRSLIYQDAQVPEMPSSKVFKIDLSAAKPSLFLTSGSDSVIDLAYSTDASRIAAVRLTVVTDSVMLSLNESSKVR